MLKFKRKFHQDRYKRILNESYITESAFYIGTEKWIDDMIKEKLIDRIEEGMDGIVAFNLFVKFLVNRFIDTDCIDIYDYINRYVEEDLADFINENFVEVEKEENKKKDNKLYIITMLCKDFERIYMDYVNEKFNDIEKARKRMFDCVNDEIDTLKSCQKEHNVVNLENSVCIYDNEQELITKYEIIEIDN